MTQTAEDKGDKPGGSRLIRFWPLAVLAAGLILFFALGLNRYATLDTLRDNREALSQWVAANQALAVLIYIGD
jgi:uncharacterized membrane protein YdjX (TVP38/TMEM64 family)